MGLGNVTRVNALAALAAGLMSLAGLGSSAHATVYDLTLDGCTGGCGTTPFGTVTVTPDTTDAGSLDVSVQLAAADFFNQAGKSPTHDSLVFDLVGDPSVTIQNISDTTDFAAGSSIANESPFGAFGYSLVYVGPSSDNSSPCCQTLSFEIFDPSATPLTLGSTDFNGTPVYFAADIYNTTTGNTGNVGATLGGVPEPASWMMLLLGLGAVGAGMRMSRQKPSVATLAV